MFLKAWIIAAILDEALIVATVLAEVLTFAAKFVDTSTVVVALTE